MSNPDPEIGTHGDGHGHIVALLFECVDDSTDGTVEKFGGFLPKDTGIGHHRRHPSVRMHILPQKSQFPSSNVMVRIVLAETAHLDVSRLFGITNVKLGCLVERVCDVVYHFRARVTRAFKFSCESVSAQARE